MGEEISANEAKDKVSGGKSQGVCPEIEIPEHNPFSPFEKGPGKPTLRDDYLVNQRDAALDLLEMMWPEIGWDLHCAKSPDDILKAFQKVASWGNLGPLTPFLRVSCEPATSEAIEETREMLRKVVPELGRGDAEYQARLRLSEEADRAVFTVSETYEKQLKEELKWRRKNVRGLKIQITGQTGKIRKAQLLKRQVGQQEDEERLDVPTLEQGLRKLREDLGGEEKLCGDIQGRLRLITPERLKIATEEAATRKSKLNSLQQFLTDATRKERELQEKLLDRQAYFFRTQLLKFIHDKKRYAHDNPLSLANAIAGLPHITCRRSASRCAKLNRKITPALSYEVFEFVRSVWERRDSKGTLSLVDWFRQNIAQLPKTQIAGRKKIENFFRKHLADNWGYLKPAIEESQKSKVHPRAMPNEIARNFLRNSRTSNSVDRILAEREKITD